MKIIEKNAVYDVNDNIVGFKCSHCGKIVDNMFGNYCNECNYIREKAEQYLKVLNKIAKQQNKE